MKTLIKNGTIVTSSDTFRSDICISDGIITRIETEIEATGSDRVIDADGKFVLPGGVDPHVHMHLPSPAGFSSDSFVTGSIAALYGGTTTFIDFVTPRRGQGLIEALELRIREAEESLIDYSLHATPVEWNQETHNAIQECIKEGINSFKLYMAYRNSIGLSDDDIQNVMKVVGDLGGMVAIHCESGDEIEILRNKLWSQRHMGPLSHAQSRPANLEAMAVKKALDIAITTGCALYIVHLSSSQSLTFLEKVVSSGQRIFSETCPQYLLLEDEVYKSDFDEAAPYIISPPLRTKFDNDALWLALNEGLVNTVGTDHCPFTLSQKRTGLDDFRKIPNGAGGIEHRLALLYTYGVLGGRISFNRMVELFSTNPARIFGLYPQKGTLVKGSDADIVIWNPKPENIISAKNHHQNCDLNIYEGFKTVGNADYVISRGRIIIDGGRFINPDTRGKFLRRKTLLL
jgi:dihydropyrimidinase